jgi:hypothetical protein
MKILDVSEQQLSCARILRRVNGLWKVDDDRSRRAHQHIELREIAVNGACAQHSNHFANQLLVDLVGLSSLEVQVSQPRSGFATGILDEFHHENAVHEIDRLRNRHTAVSNSVEGVDFSVPPSCLVLFFAVSGPLRNRPLVPGIARLAAFGVFGSMLEGPVIRLFVNLGDAFHAFDDHDEDLSLLPTHEGPDDFSDDPVVHQSLETLWGLHTCGVSESARGLQRPTRSQLAPKAIRLSR